MNYNINMEQDFHKITVEGKTPQITMHCEDGYVKFEIPILDEERLATGDESEFCCYVTASEFDKIFELFVDPSKRNHFSVSSSVTRNNMDLFVYVGDELTVLKIMKVNFYIDDMRSITVDTVEFTKEMKSMKNALRLHKVGREW